MQKLSEIKIDIISSKKKYYVYLLYSSDGIPFYVGKGRSNRISAHEAETRYFLRGRKWIGMNTFKLNVIAKIWRNNENVYYTIDSWHDLNIDAGNRELELVEEFGRRILDSGPLTNIRNGGDRLTEQDRLLLGQKIRQFYIDNPQAREDASKRHHQFFIDNPEMKSHLSSVLKNYCIDHPEFIDLLQEKKNKWIKINPEAYKSSTNRRLLTSRSHAFRKKMSETMKSYFQERPDELERIKQQGRDFWIDNPEAVEKARQVSIDNGSSEHIIKWLATVSREVLEQKFENHSQYMTEWHQTEDGKIKTKQAAEKRNLKVRTEEHRQHMSKKTKESIKNNRNAYDAGRVKFNEWTNRRKELRQECLDILRNILIIEGKSVKKDGIVTYAHLNRWKKMKWISDFPDSKTATIEDWLVFKEHCSKKQLKAEITA